MGAGYHGGFGETRGSRKVIREKNKYSRTYKRQKKRIFTPVQFKGTVTVNGKKKDVSRRVYQRNDINFEYYDNDTGETNLQRMLKGNAPFGRDGKPLELHHVLQKESGTMVEIHETTHRKYKRILHGLIGKGESFRNNKELDSQYRQFRRVYWKWRAELYIGGRTR